MEDKDADKTALRRLYASDRAAHLILDDFAGRQRNQRVTKVDQVLSRLSTHALARTDVIRIFRKLEELGYGEFVEGRRGHPSRFEWRFGLVSVGKAAAGTSQVLEEVRENEDEDDDSEPTSVNLPGSLSHKFQLRPDWQIDLILPSDLTAREALRLSDFVKTLPFDPVEA